MRPPVNVLLTGATGFLKRKLVDSLAASNKVGAIHIFSNTNPVTDDEKKTDSKVAEEELIEIRLDSGDLLETHLGLSDLSFSSPWT